MARRYNLGKPYTQEEIDLILLTPKRNLSLLAEKLGRNAETIRRKRWKLEHEEQDKLSRNKSTARAQKENMSSAKFANTRWTKEEEALLLTSKKTDIELAKELKRTVYSISIKRFRLLKEDKTKIKKQYGKNWEKEIRKGVQNVTADRQGDTEQIQ